MKNQYSEFVQSIKNTGYDEMRDRMTPEFLDTIHGAVGVAGEAGELMDSVKKTFMYGKPLDIENIKEEAGDCLYYLELLLNSVGSSIDEAIQLNVAKLSVRYSEGSYSNAQALARADKV